MIDTSDIDKAKIMELINLISDIGYDYISNPTDALNYTKAINLLKYELTRD
jgi:hypothetical protein